jgi:C-terminal processing protease CtpA/Prc
MLPESFCADLGGGVREMTMVKRRINRASYFLGNFLVATNLLAIPPRPVATDNYTDRDREYAVEMLHTIQNDLETKYFDPTFHGLDMKVRFQEAETRIQNAQSHREAMESLEWVLEGLDDSHTFLIPPLQPFQVDYGFEFQFYGKNCYITQVKKGSDAEKKGLKTGDQLLGIDGRKLARSQFSRLTRSLYLVSPRAVTHLSVLSPGETSFRTITVQTKVHPLPQLLDPESTRDSGFDINWRLRNLEASLQARKPTRAEVADVLVWRQPAFLPSSNPSVSVDNSPEPLGEKPASLLGRANKMRALVLDLRGNLGGSVRAEKWLLARIFDHDVHIYDIVSRRQAKPEILKSQGKHAFAGFLIVLVDSNSSSAAEVFARVVQLEKRGLIMGDHTSGQVRESLQLRHNVFQAGSTPQYVLSVSVADLILADGKSLEGEGVTPDILMVPTQEDLADGRDPVLAEALKFLGYPMDAAQAGKLVRPK